MNRARSKSFCKLFVGFISATITAAAFGALSGCSAPVVTAVSTGTTITSGGDGVITTTTGSTGSIQYVATPSASTIDAFQSPSSGDASVLQFAASSSGSVTPSATLVLPAPQILSWNGIATDFNGNIYAWGNQIANQPSEILAYSTNAGPTPTVMETIVGSPSTFLNVTNIAICSMGDVCIETGSAGNAAILFIPQGTQTPQSIIKGSLTGLDGTGYMAVDGSANLYVSTSTPGQILVFSPPTPGILPPAATENVAPARVIGGTNTLLTSGILGMDASETGDIFAVVWVPSTNSTKIVEFSTGASGNVAPIATIDGTIAGEQAVNVRVDEVGNLYVLCESQALPPSGTSPLIAVFLAPIASGATPARQFTSAAWTASTGNFALY